MNKIYSLNNIYSTTKLCYKLLDDKYLDENGKMKENYKFKLNFPEFGIIDSKIPAKDDEKFDTYLFLQEGEGRKSEGGLRTKGYFKFSYEKKDNDWYIVENKKLIKRVNLDENFVKEYEKLPLISIITVVFNGEKYLEETIQSVINQTYPNVEYIIIDGGSTDGTVDIINKYEDRIDYWVSEKDDGISDAFNKGVICSFGKRSLMLNAGDFLIDDFFLNDNIIDLSKNTDVVFYSVKVNNSKYLPRLDIQDNIQLILEEVQIPHQGAFVSLKAYKKYGLYNKNFKIRMDYELFSRFILNKASFNFINKIIVNYLEGGVSMQLKNRALFEVEAIIVNYIYGNNLKDKNLKIYIKKILYIIYLILWRKI